MTGYFVLGDAGNILQQWSKSQNTRFSTIITSPPYYGCRDYSELNNNLGEFHTGTNQLGHEDTPFAYVKNLANKFGSAKDAKYLRDDGSLWIIIGDTFARKNYIDTNFVFPPIQKGEAIGIPMLLTMEMRRLGWKLNQEIIWNKPSVPPSGAIKKRCNPCHEYILVFYIQSMRWYPSPIREEGKTPIGTKMPPVGGKKYKTVSNTSMKTESVSGDNNKDGEKILISDGKRARQDVWTICPSRNKSKHVAPFPDDIPKLAILATTKIGDLICDPFAGTRTTERVSVELGRSCVSVDIYDYSQ